MGDDEEVERRRFARFENSFEGNQKSALLLVTVPALAEGPIRPEDFSSGGFRFLLDTPPAVGTEVDCTVKVFDITVSGMKGEVTWTAKSDSHPPAWNVGLSIDISDGERDVLSSLMTALLTGSYQNV